MITHRIHKGTIQHIRELFNIKKPPDDIPALVAARVQQQADPPSVVDHVVPDQRQLAQAYLGDKQAYNEWLNSVMQKWKIGDTFTLTVYPIMSNRLTAPPLFEIHSFQEIRHLCQWDGFFQEPKVIGAFAENGGFAYFSQKAIRQLTDHEKFLVNVQHKQRQEAASGVPAEAANDGSEYSGNPR